MKADLEKKAALEPESESIWSDPTGEKKKERARKRKAAPDSVADMRPMGSFVKTIFVVVDGDHEKELVSRRPYKTTPDGQTCPCGACTSKCKGKWAAGITDSSGEEWRCQECGWRRDDAAAQEARKKKRQAYNALPQRVTSVAAYRRPPGTKARQRAWQREKRLKLSAEREQTAAASEDGCLEGQTPNYNLSGDYTREDILVVLQAAAAGNGMSVHAVLSVTIPYTVRWLIANNQLGIEFRPLAVAFEHAGTAARQKRAFNAAGAIPRGALEAANATRAQVRHVLDVVVQMDLGNEDTDSYYSEYSTSSRHSRYKPFAALDGHKASLKWGDSIKWPRFDEPNVKLESPAAWRYGWKIASKFLSEWFAFGYGNRVVRVLNELLINWLARDIAAESGFAPNRLTGDEGLLGPEARAEHVLRAVYDRVFEDPLFRQTMPLGRGYRCGGGVACGGEWQFE